MPSGPYKLGWQVIVGRGLGLNVLAGGYARETFSAHCWRRREDLFWKQARVVVDFLFFWQPQHCMTQYLRELEIYEIYVSSSK